jgi:hypothetical protein
MGLVRALSHYSGYELARAAQSGRNEVNFAYMAAWDISVEKLAEPTIVAIRDQARRLLVHQSRACQITSSTSQLEERLSQNTEQLTWGIRHIMQIVQKCLFWWMGTEEAITTMAAYSNGRFYQLLESFRKGGLPIGAGIKIGETQIRGETYGIHVLPELSIRNNRFFFTGSVSICLSRNGEWSGTYIAGLQRKWCIPRWPHAPRSESDCFFDGPPLQGTEPSILACSYIRAQDPVRDTNDPSLMNHLIQILMEIVSGDKDLLVCDVCAATGLSPEPGASSLRIDKRLLDAIPDFGDEERKTWRERIAENPILPPHSGPFMPRTWNFEKRLRGAEAAMAERA